MRSLLSTIRQFLSELRRRNVYRVAGTYVVVGFFVIEGADLVLPRLGLPPWTVTFVIVLVGLGFPIALVLAWALEMTPEGVRVDKAEGSRETARGSGGFSLSNGVIAGLLVIAIGLLLYPKIFSSGGGSGEESSPAAPDTATINERSVAVLPFEALSRGEESKTFARGIHDDLLTRLSNISDLQVISRTSVEQYRNTDLSLPAIADSLDVRWVMEGGVLQADDQIQVNAQLIDPRTDSHVWAEDYQRDLSAENLFAIQGEITREIADALQAKLTVGEQDRITGAPTKNLRAYRLYVKGRSQLDTRSEEGMRRAVDYFRQALQEDSTFAPAWAGLADAIGLYPQYGPDSLGASVPSHEEAARRALKFDPDLAEAHAALGFFLYNKQMNGPAALRELKKAVRLKPSYAQAQHWLGLVQLHLGRLKEAKTHMLRAVKLNPQHRAANLTLFQIYLAEGQAKKALTRVRRDMRRTGARPIEHCHEAAALFYLDRFEEARKASRTALDDVDGKGRAYICARTQLAMIHAAVGDTSRVKKWLDRLEKRPESLGPLTFLARGLAHAALGNKEAAFSAFQGETVRGAAVMILRYWYPDVLGPLREDPRYEKLLREINQQWGLNPDGSLPEETGPRQEPQADA